MKHQMYVGEFNRCLGDNIPRCARRLDRLGIPTSVIAHKTALRMERPHDMNWPDFARAVRSQLNPRNGSVLLHSQRTGNTFLCRNRGNRRSKFERV